MVDKADGKGPLGRHGGRWEIKIKPDRKEVRWEDVDLIDVAQDRNKWRVVVNAIKSGEFRTSFCIELSTVLTAELKLHERQSETVPQFNYTYTGP